MAVVTFNPDVVQSSRVALEEQQHSVAAEIHQQQERTADLERRLRQANANFLSHAEFDLWLLREALGIDALVSGLHASAARVEDTCSHFWRAINAVRESHPGPVAEDIDHQTQGISGIIAGALDSLTALPSRLDMQTLPENVMHPDALVHAFATAGDHLSALERACAALYAFLEQLQTDERNLLDQIHGLLEDRVGPIVVHLPATSLLSPVAGVSATVVVQPGSSGAFSADPVSRGQAIGDYAKQMASQLQVNDGRVRALDPKWLASLPPDEQQLVKNVIARAPGYWSQDDIECVAFVALAYGFAFHNAGALPDVRNAYQFWRDYASRQGWTEIPNGASTPESGDIIVMTGGADGHVAIVTGPAYDEQHRFIGYSIAQSNIRPDSKHPDPSQMVWAVDSNGKLVSPWSGYSIKGMIRYTG